MNELDQPAGILQGAPGVFYSEAGQSGPHVALSITAEGQRTTLATIRTPDQLPSRLVSAANNLFYSVIEQGTHPAHVFSVSSAADSQKIYEGQGLHPILMQNLPDGELLAVAVAPVKLVWSLAKVSLDGTVKSLYQFPQADRPWAAIYASDGNYYGVAQDANASSGYIYRLTSSGALTKLYHFPSGTFTGFYGVPLLEASDGNLYGALPNGGANQTGAIYRVTLAGQYKTLYSFPEGILGGPSSLIEGSNGNLYGSTLGNVKKAGYSQLFRIDKAGKFSVVYSLSNVRSDGACQCSLVLGDDGLIYGTAVAGGVYGGGTYFALDVGEPKPAPRPSRFNPPSGAAGAKVLIWGSNLLGATVRFNRTEAVTVSNSGTNYVWATVPAGATTGPITVTTPGGTVATHHSFQVQ